MYFDEAYLLLRIAFLVNDVARGLIDLYCNVKFVKITKNIPR